MYYIYHIPGVKIGCTQNPKNRIKQQKFFHYEILEEHFDVFEASNREIQLQKQYGYKVDNIPYWISLERITKAKKIAEQTRQQWMPEVIKNLIGKPRSEETKEKISKNHTECSGKNNPFYGKKHSEESKKRMSNSKKGKQLSKKQYEARCKKVVQKDLNGKIIKIYNSRLEAAKSVGCSSAMISYCCNKICKTAKGFIWEKYA